MNPFLTKATYIVNILEELLPHYTLEMSQSSPLYAAIYITANKKTDQHSLGQPGELCYDILFRTWQGNTDLLVTDTIDNASKFKPEDWQNHNQIKTNIQNFINKNLKC